jgi:hypothetical protein
VAEAESVWVAKEKAEAEDPEAGAEAEDPEAGAEDPEAGAEDPEAEAKDIRTPSRLFIIENGAPIKGLQALDE